MAAETYATARKMLADLVAKRISARELLDAHVARRNALHEKLNAVVATDLEHAQAAAKSIDDARVHGANLGALAGLPMTIKDGFDVFGMPATSGNPAWADRAKDCNDADLVARARKEGAIIWGKTNVPFMLSDFQSYNAIYGTTNNPHDVTRTSGGSSGGAAVALATGMTPLEIGSDIGGSLRHPANFCGVFSLKPTWGVLPVKGHIPPPPGIDVEIDLNVCGPMARNAGDLKLLWDVLNKRAPSDIKPAKGGRIALWDEEEGWPLDDAVKARVQAAGRAFEHAGFIVERAKPRIDMMQMMATYLDILMPIISAELSGETMPTGIRDTLERRETYKIALAAFFAEGWEGLIMPITPVPAFPHDHSEPFNSRMVTVNGVAMPYVTMLSWISLATSLHSPALAMPAGRAAEGLPVGVQLVGPEHGDDRLFELAAAAEEALGGFSPPNL